MTHPLAEALRAAGARLGPWPAPLETRGSKPLESEGALPPPLESPLDFGDVAAEEAACHDSVGVVPLAAATLVEVGGKDAPSFLHNITSQGAKGLPEGGGAPALIMTPKGRIVAEVAVLRAGPERYVLTAEPGLGEKLTEWLDRYVIMEDVTLRSDDVVAFAIVGPRAAAVLERIGRAAPTSDAPIAARFDAGLIRSRDRGATAGFDILVPPADAGALLDALAEAAAAEGGRLSGTTALDLVRIVAGQPVYGRDLLETTLPQEVGLEESHLDWEKGCYIGQEVVSRLKFRGHTNRSLEGLLLVGDALPAPGSALRAGDREIGWVTSVGRSPRRKAGIALGMVHRDAREPGTTLTIAGDPPIEAEVVRPPFGS